MKIRVLLGAAAVTTGVVLPLAPALANSVDVPAAKPLVSYSAIQAEDANFVSTVLNKTKQTLRVMHPTQGPVDVAPGNQTKLEMADPGNWPQHARVLFQQSDPWGDNWRTIGEANLQISADTEESGARTPVFHAQLSDSQSASDFHRFTSSAPLSWKSSSGAQFDITSTDWRWKWGTEISVQSANQGDFGLRALNDSRRYALHLGEAILGPDGSHSVTFPGEQTSTIERVAVSMMPQGQPANHSQSYDDLVITHTDAVHRVTYAGRSQSVSAGETVVLVSDGDVKLTYSRDAVRPQCAQLRLVG